MSVGLPLIDLAEHAAGSGPQDLDLGSGTSPVEHADQAAGVELLAQRRLLDGDAGEVRGQLRAGRADADAVHRRHLAGGLAVQTPADELAVLEQGAEAVVPADELDRAGPAFGVGRGLAGRAVNAVQD